MEKKTPMIKDQGEYVDTHIHGPEVDQDTSLEKDVVETLLDGKETTPESIDTVGEGRDVDEQKIAELSESLKGEDEEKEPKGLDPEELTRRLEFALCYAYDVYLHAQRDGEHCPTVTIGDYVFAALGFTCGRVDQVKVFKKIEKKVLLVFKKKGYVPVEVTKDIVNILVKAGGVLPPLEDEFLQ